MTFSELYFSHISYFFAVELLIFQDWQPNALKKNTYADRVHF